MSLMEWNEQGKIIREESIWDAIPVLKQIGAI